MASPLQPKAGHRVTVPASVLSLLCQRLVKNVWELWDQFIRNTDKKAQQTLGLLNSSSEVPGTERFVHRCANGF